MLLDDIVIAAASIEKHTRSLSFEEYESNDLVRSAVERKFLIIGEAMVRLKEHDRETLESISEYQKIIGFRNRLAHGYDYEIDNSLVWQVIRSSFQALSSEAAAILSEVE